MSKRDFRSLEKRILSIKKKSNNLDLNIIGEVVHEGKKYNMYMLETSHKQHNKPKICISAGVHGGEADGIAALLEFVEKNVNNPILDEVNLTVIPVVNIVGYIENDNDVCAEMYHQFGKKDQTSEQVKSVESALARKKFDLFLDLHGGRYKGFYCYETKEPRLPSIAKEVISSMAKKRLKIYNGTAGEKGGKAKKRSRGVISSNKDEDTLESYMHKKGAAYSITCEYPGALARSDSRRKYMRIAIETAIDEFKPIFEKYKKKIRQKKK